MEPIKGFFGDNRWLSNFHAGKCEWGKLIFPSRENAYQYAKGVVGGLVPMTQQGIDLLRFHVGTVDGNVYTPKEAKQAGRKVPLSPNWDLWKFPIMRDIVWSAAKHDNAFFNRLFITADAYLEESNYWHDVVYGVCYGEMFGKKCKEYPHEPMGENNLGKILMEVRSRYQIEDFLIDKFSWYKEPIPSTRLGADTNI